VMTLCFAFFLMEVAGGLVAGSLALMSDAFHLLSGYSFGYHRAEIVGVLVSVFFLWFLTLTLVVNAIDRLRNPQPIDSLTMLSVAIVGLVVNLMQHHGFHGHSHKHKHDHKHEHHNHGKVGWRIGGTMSIRFMAGQMNINIRAAWLHAIGDMLSSLGVVISSIWIHLHPEHTFVDPICTLFFSVMVMVTTVGITRETLHILMEAVPRDVDLDQVEQALLAIGGVQGIHGLHGVLSDT
ncbi:cation efflux protein, partial [Syncephalis pseudoplumigaleata]